MRQFFQKCISNHETKQSEFQSDPSSICFSKMKCCNSLFIFLLLFFSHFTQVLQCLDMVTHNHTFLWALPLIMSDWGIRATFWVLTISGIKSKSYTFPVKKKLTCYGYNIHAFVNTTQLIYFPLLCWCSSDDLNPVVILC